MISNLSFGESMRLKKDDRIEFDRFILSTEQASRTSGASRATLITYLEVFLSTTTNVEDVFKFLKGEIESFEPQFI